MELGVDYQQNKHASLLVHTQGVNNAMMDGSVRFLVKSSNGRDEIPLAAFDSRSAND